MAVRFTSNVNKLRRHLAKATRQSFDQMGEVGVENIKQETPERTGTLKAGTYYHVKRNTLLFQNDVSYGPFVEYGTYKQHANPFMRRGIRKSTAQFVDILISKLGV